jgi:hypothetical protein
MSIIGDVFRDLLGMFLPDSRLALAILFLVAMVAGLVAALRVEAFLGGGVLLFGSLAILVEAVSREARGRGRQ